MITLFTIGHSNHSLARFSELLQDHGIEQLVDVRSQPFSRRFPQFSRRPLGEHLQAIEVSYVFEGEVLGGRPVGAHWYRGDGSLDYLQRSRAEEFTTSVARVCEMAKQQRSVLMCAEENPQHCHRRALLAPAFQVLDVAIMHVRGDGTLQPEQEDLFGNIR